MVSRKTSDRGEWVWWMGVKRSGVAWKFRSRPDGENQPMPPPQKLFMIVHVCLDEGKNQMVGRFGSRHSLVEAVPFEEIWSDSKTTLDEACCVYIWSFISNVTRLCPLRRKRLWRVWSLSCESRIWMTQDWHIISWHETLYIDLD